MMVRLLPALALVAACGTQTETIDGQVVDVWGNAVPEATVVLEGHTTRPTTDEYGNFTLPMQTGTLKIKAGRDGYIQEHVEVEVTEGEELPDITIKLYPKPEEPGFYVVGKGEYERLEPARVYMTGNDLAKVTGLKAVETRIEASDLEVVFHTDLRMDEIMRLGLELHQLEYKKKATLPGPLGPAEEFTLNMWTSKGELEIEVDPMRSKNDYRIKATAPLEPGYYAFHTQDLLDPSEPALVEEIPEALRVAFAFEAR